LFGGARAIARPAAQTTGTTLRTVSRALSGREQSGLVESGWQRIMLREPHKIFLLAEHGADDDGPATRA
jgi:CRP/FNR family transcriptional regulator, nitrogen oxide reductase regulator